MKKIFGTISIVILTFTFFYNTDLRKSDITISIQNLELMNNANAEDPEQPNKMPSAVLCSDQTEYKTDCVGWGRGCTPTSC